MILDHHGANHKVHTVEALAAAFFSISSKLTASDTVYGDRSLGAPGQLFGSNAATFLRSFSSLSIASLTGTPSKAFKSLPDALAGMTATSRAVSSPVARSFHDPRRPFYALARRVLDTDHRARGTNDLDHFRVDRSRTARARARRDRPRGATCGTNARPRIPPSSSRARTSIPIDTCIDRSVSPSVRSIGRSIYTRVHGSIDFSMGSIDRSIDRSTRACVDRSVSPWVRSIGRSRSTDRVRPIAGSIARSIERDRSNAIESIGLPIPRSIDALRFARDRSRKRATPRPWRPEARHFRARCARESPRMPSPPRVIVVVGPTGSGKSRLAIELARALGGDVVNADALQFHDSLPICTARVREDEMEGVRHHLVGCVKYGEYFDVRAFRARAGSIVRKCVGEGRSVIVVGGSNYYAQALVSDSLMDVRDGDEEGYISDECSIDDIRLDGGRRTATEDRTLGVDASTAHARLADVDPESAQRLHPNDIRRVRRYLEIFDTTGERPSDVFKRERTMKKFVSQFDALGCRTVFIALKCDSKVLDESSSSTSPVHG